MGRRHDRHEIRVRVVHRHAGGFCPRGVRRGHLSGAVPPVEPYPLSKGRLEIPAGDGPVRALPVLPLRNLRHDLHHGIAGRRHRGLFPPLHRRSRMAVPRRKADQADHYRHAACRGGRRRGLPRRRKLGSGVQSHSRQPADGRCRPVRDGLRRVRALHFPALLLPEHLSHSSARRDHRIPAFRVHDAHARQRHHARNRRPALYGPRRGFPRVSELQLRAQAS